MSTIDNLMVVENAEARPTALKTKNATHRHRHLYLWILPALLVYVAFKLVPMIGGLGLSMLRWDGIKDAIFVGFQNFQRMADDDKLLPALLHNVQYALGTVTGKISLALFLAILLNQALRGRTFYRTMLFLPVIMSFAVVSILWTWMYNDQFGLINSLLRGVGLNALAVQWLGDPRYALLALMFVDIWKWYGFHMVIFLAGLQSIPQEYYEAARVDGATRWQQFAHITLPQLRPVMIVNITLALLGAFNVFEIPYIMTQGGPVNATNVLSLYSYSQAFQSGRIGYGAALSYVILLIVGVIAIVQLRLTAANETLNKEG